MNEWQEVGRETASEQEEAVEPGSDVGGGHGSIGSPFVNTACTFRAARVKGRKVRMQAGWDCIGPLLRCDILCPVSGYVVNPTYPLWKFDGWLLEADGPHYPVKDGFPLVPMVRHACAKVTWMTRADACIPLGWCWLVAGSADGLKTVGAWTEG